MPRTTLTDEQRQQGRALGRAIRRFRAGKPAADVADASGVRLDTLRKLEQGGIPTPGFFLIADLARALRVDLDALDDEVRHTLTKDMP